MPIPTSAELAMLGGLAAVAAYVVARELPSLPQRTFVFRDAVVLITPVRADLRGRVLDDLRRLDALLPSSVARCSPPVPHRLRHPVRLRDRSRRDAVPLDPARGG